MCEFIPFCPFSNNNLSMSSPQPIESLVKQQEETDPSPCDSYWMPEDSPQLTHQSTSKQKAISSNHNMVKQLIITIKHMMKNCVKQIGAGKMKKIIQEIWTIFIQDKHPNKELLKALFESFPEQRLLRKYKLNEVIDFHGLEDYNIAIDLLKHEILFRMKSQNVKSHLLDRRVQSKERLSAFILYFIHEELRVGKIASRQGERATEKIEKILEKSKQQEMFMDCFFSSAEEVVERFASINH